MLKETLYGILWCLLKVRSDSPASVIRHVSFHWCGLDDIPGSMVSHINNYWPDNVHFHCLICSMTPLKFTDLNVVHVPLTGDTGKITEKTIKVFHCISPLDFFHWISNVSTPSSSSNCSNFFSQNTLLQNQVQLQN